MSTGTGESEQGLRKILDFTRMGSIAILLLHFYFYCYSAFRVWKFTFQISDNFLANLSRTGLFKSILISKCIAFILLSVSLIGARGKKNEKISVQRIAVLLIAGNLIYFLSSYVLKADGPPDTVAIIYMVVCSSGYLLLLAGGTFLSRLIKLRFDKDIFNEFNESFPQEEKIIANENSINFITRYKYKGSYRNGSINIPNPYRGLLVLGTPGSGKTFFVIKPIIKQHIEKGFAMLVYDFKFPDLSLAAYNVLQKNKSAFKKAPKFFVINLDDPRVSNRCNPIRPETMFDIVDAIESARSILMGLNRTWIMRQGDFFVESAINFLTAIIWFLKKYNNGRFCTLPHAIELMQVDYEKLFPVLKTEKEISVLISPFISAYQNKVMETLDNQVASAKIAIARLSSPQLYWALSEHDFDLDINNPDEPKVICLANNPQKDQIFGAVLSLYVNRLIRLVNKKDQQKCSLIFDEFPTIYFNGMDKLIATARSNKVATCLGIQDFSQLRKDYGLEQSAVIFNIVGNIICGQVTGDTAKQLSERFGKIVQVKESISINRTDTSVSKSGQLDSAIPASKIAELSSGEFVGMIADEPANKIELKKFHCEIIKDFEEMKKEEENYMPLPIVKEVTLSMVMENYYNVKRDIDFIIDNEIEKLLNAMETNE